MLQELHIESLGGIDRLDLVLSAGLTALTGETGAGKTMLVEAISLLVGGRADASMVRPGADEARVEGRFVVGDDEYVVARVIPADGRSRAYVNGRLATVATLAELGERTVDLHGQHAHQSLLATSHQRTALDRWCQTDLEPLRAARARLTEIDAALAALGGDSRARPRRRRRSPLSTTCWPARWSTAKPVTGRSPRSPTTQVRSTRSVSLRGCCTDVRCSPNSNLA